MTELLITSKVPGRLIYWKFPSKILSQTDTSGGAINTQTIYYIGQNFEAQDKKIGVVKTCWASGPTNIEIQLWGAGWQYLETIYDGPRGGNGWQTYKITNMQTEMTVGKWYVLVFYGKGSDISIYRSSSNVIPGNIYYSLEDPPQTWRSMINYDLALEILFGSTVMSVDELGYSEAYILRVEYLEDETEIVVDDEIRFIGDAGEMDDLPAQILVPFRKAEWVSGSVKFYGVGIP